MIATVVFDFDGVIHSYASGWTGMIPEDGPEPGALEAVQWAQSEGYEVVIQSTRAATQEGHTAMREWLRRYGFPDGLRVTDQKVPAVAYIDDRAVVHRPGQDDWNDVQRRVQQLHEGTTLGQADERLRTQLALRDQACVLGGEEVRRQRDRADALQLRIDIASEIARTKWGHLGDDFDRILVALEKTR